MSNLRFHFPGVYEVVKTEDRKEIRVVAVEQFAWFCEREDCGWSGVGHTSEQAALNEAVRHQHREHLAAEQADIEAAARR